MSQLSGATFFDTAAQNSIQIIVGEADLDAPLYPPASGYVEPRLMPGQYTAKYVTIGELLAAPATRAIVLSDPTLAKLLHDPPFKHHLYNFTLDILAFIAPGIKPAAIERIERELAALPQDQWPRL